MPNDLRLPSFAYPVCYSVELDLDVNNRRFDGRESVQVVLEKRTDFISLHAKCLDISSIELSASGGKIPIKSVACDVSMEILTINFEQQLEPCSLKLLIAFSGRIFESGLSGLYVCKDDNGNFMTQSHFQASFARSVFPCWDEPFFKAKFILSISVEAEFDLSCISNMPVKSEKRFDNRVCYTFQETPVMSTYLLGMAVGKYDFAVSETSGSGIPIRVFSTVGKGYLGQYAADMAAVIIPFFEDFFQIPYMLPKLDIVAVPQHAFSAMENWGILMYRENCILIGNDAAESKKVEVVKLVAHEIAHQWFGNYVTCDWWSQIWLNEGFAEWTEYFVSSALFPHRKVWFDFLHYELVGALNVDAFQTSHPLEVPIATASETAEIFDTVTYSKGCSLVRMIYNFVGDEKFRKAVTGYLNKFAYKTASTSDLWEAFDDVSDKKISRVMQSYVLKTGYPVLDVKITEDDTLSIATSTFSTSGDSAKSRDCFVSVKYLEDSGKSDIQSEFSCDGFAHFKKIPVSDLLVNCNPECMWLCRVSYPIKLWRRLGIAAADYKKNAVSSEERFSFQNDLFALGMANWSNGYSVAHWLAFITQYTQSERSYAVWKDIACSLSYLSNLAFDIEQSSTLKVFVQQLVGPIFEELGWDSKRNERSDAPQLRALLIELLGENDDPKVLSGCQIRFGSYIRGVESIDSELKQAIFSVVAFHGNKGAFDNFIKLYKEAVTDEARSTVLAAIGCFQEQEARNLVIDWLEHSELAVSVYPRLLQGMAKSADGRQVALEFLIKNWSRLVASCSGASGLIFGFILHAALDHFMEEEVADLIEIQFENETLQTAKRSIQLLVDRIRALARWSKNDSASIKGFFKLFCDPEFTSFSNLFEHYFADK